MRSKGFTLVELIVCMAIIIALAVVAVPTLRAVGILGRDHISAGAGQVIAILKAARTYAGTYNVDTAVAWNIDVRTDSWSQEPCEVLTGASVMRRMTTNELDALIEDLVSSGELQKNETDVFRKRFVGSESASRLPFLAVGGADNSWRKLPSGVVVGCHALNPPTTPALIPSIDGWKNRSGLCPIRVLDQDLSVIEPVNAFCVEEHPEDLLPPEDWVPTTQATEWIPEGNPEYAMHRWPAVIFTPQGYAMVPPADPPATEKLRFVLSVVPSPDSDDHDRMPTEGHPVPAADVEVFSTIGKIAAVE